MRLATPALSAICLLFSLGTALAATPSTSSNNNNAPAGNANASSAAATTANHPFDMKSGQFATEALAKKSCGTNPVVWVNTKSKVIHPANDQYFGKTRQGAFMCQNTAEKDGYHTQGQANKTASKG